MTPRALKLKSLNRSQAAGLLIVLGGGLIAVAVMVGLQLGTRPVLIACVATVWTAIEAAWFLRDEAASRRRRMRRKGRPTAG